MGIAGLDWALHGQFCNCTICSCVLWPEIDRSNKSAVFLSCCVLRMSWLCLLYRANLLQLLALGRCVLRALACCRHC